MPPVLHVARMGNMGNHMIQLMTALTLQRMVPGAVLSAEGMPDWGLHFGHVSPAGRRVHTVTENRLNLPALAAALRDGRADYVEMRTYAQHIDHFTLPRAEYARFFPIRHAREGGAADELVINIRAGEVLAAPHPDYTLVPIEFYRQMVRETGLRPVFCGQTTPGNPYIDRLRQAFPHALFRPDTGPLETFDYLRLSRHLLPAVSTFSWLAAFLSEAETVILPVYGMLNPLQCQKQNFLPLSDPRWRFMLFPASYAVVEPGVEAAHAAMLGLWRQVTPAVMADYIATCPRVRLRPETVFPFFDEAFYLRHYSDIDDSVRAGHLPSGRHHFEWYGVHEGREPFRLDPSWYVTAYPVAALELGQGEFLNPIHHYCEVGAARGYRPVPPA